MSEAAVPHPQSAGEAVFVFGSVAMRRGGVTRMVLARMQCYAEAGIKVRLLLTKYGPNEGREEAAVREAWSLPDSVEFRYFWRDAAPGGGGAPADRLAAAGEEPGLTSTTKSTANTTLVDFHDGEGLPVKTKRFTPEGRLQRVDRYDGGEAVVAQEHYDPHGRLVISDGMDPESGKPSVRRWFGRSGACWLTAWLNEEGRPRKSVRHQPEPVGYDHFGHCVAEWVDEEIAGSQAPVVFSDTREQDATLLTVRHTTARRVAVVHNGHTAKPYRTQDFTKVNYRPLLEHLDQVDTLVVLTARQRRDIAARYGGANPTVINHSTPAVPELAPPREPGLLVAVARLESQKRIEDAIRAFAVAAPAVPQARFDVYGAGRDAASLKKLVADLGITERVRFRGFTASPLEVLASASAMVLTSRYEGWGLVITEAMAVGTPVVAYDINYGPAEVIRHEVDGLLASPDDIDGLAAAMVRVLGDPDYAARLGERAREVSERFSADRWRGEWLDLFTSLTDQPPRRITRARPATETAPAGPPTSPRARRRRPLQERLAGKRPPDLLRRARLKARPALRPARALASRVLLGAALLAERLRGRKLVVLVCGSSARTAARASRTVRVASVLRIPATVLLLDYVHDPTLERTLGAALSRPPGRPLGRTTTPGEGRAAPEIPTEGLSPGPIPGPDGKWRAGYYREGSPVLAVAERSRRMTVHHYGDAGLPIRRDEIDESGMPVRVIEMDPSTGRDVELRYLDEDGTCWLSVAISPDGKRAHTRQYRPNEREFGSFRTAQQEWVTDWLAEQAAPTSVLAIDRAGAAIAEAVDRPSVTVRANGSVRRRR